METVIQHNQESEYQEILRQAVAVIETARSHLAQAIIIKTNEIHWNIGKILYERKLDSKYGDGIVKRLSVDLKAIYPKLGLSERNLWDMKRYYDRFRLSSVKLRQAVAVLPWWSINHLIGKFKNDDDAILYYADKTIEKGWNRDLLANAVRMGMHIHSVGKNESNNFEVALHGNQASYANEVFKDTYCLGFLGVTEPLLELDLERRLVEKIKQFLLELGNGFTFIGNQHILSLNGKDYKVDMLFFHRGLRSLVAIDLKISAFRPEYVGKMNFYLSLLDKQEKAPEENPSIGIILCAEKDNVEVELALDGITKPIGVAQYELVIPKRKLKEIISEEIKSFTKEIPTTRRSD